MKAYVIMKVKISPIAIYQARPHLIVYSLNEAKATSKSLNEKAMNNEYWYEPVKVSTVEYGK